MHWSKWPYWLKGGLIGSGITSVFVVIYHLCLYATFVISPGNDFGLLCIVTVDYSPTYPAILLVSSLFPNLPFSYLTLTSIPIWFFAGAIIGQLISVFRKTKNN